MFKHANKYGPRCLCLNDVFIIKKFSETQVRSMYINDHISIPNHNHHVNAHHSIHVTCAQYDNYIEEYK